MYYIHLFHVLQWKNIINQPNWLGRIHEIPSF